MFWRGVLCLFCACTQTQDHKKEPNIVAQSVAAPAPSKEQPPTAREVPIAPEQPIVDITVDEKGYNPSTVTVEKNQATHFRVKRVFERTCADGIVIPAAKINKPLPLGKTIEFALIVNADTPFGCPMGMMISGKIGTGSPPPRR